MPRAARRDLRILAASLGLSAFGDELALTALMIKATELFAEGSGSAMTYASSSSAVAAILIAGTLPQVLFAPFAGWLVDRTESTMALRVASLVQAGLALGLAVTDDLTMILLLSFLLGVGATVAAPATFTLIPAIVGSEHTTVANGWMESARYAGWVLGPLVAGTVSLAAGSHAALYFDAATFVVIAIAATMLRAREPAAPGPIERPIREAMAGLRAIRGDRVLVAAIVVVSLTVVFAAMDNVAEVFFAYDVLGKGAFGLGALATGWLGGMVLGAAVVARRVSERRQAVTLPVCAAVAGVAVVLAAVLANFPLAVLLFAVGGVANGTQNVSMRSLIHRRVPEAVRGRVFAAYSGAATAAQLGATALGAPIVVAAGAQAALLIGGLGGLVVGLTGLVWMRAVTRERVVATSWG
jgi:MFS family permease